MMREVSHVWVCNIKMFSPCCCIYQIFYFYGECNRYSIQLTEKHPETLKLWAEKPIEIIFTENATDILYN